MFERARARARARDIRRQAHHLGEQQKAQRRAEDAAQHPGAQVAPRLGLADAIVDLVSSGSTLRTNGLRSLGALLSSQAVLIARRGSDERAREMATVLRSVVEARETRYLMLNAPETALEEICRIVPGSRSPSIVPLAEPGMVALQALVPAADVWRLLPQLEAAGGSSILLVPVERMLP